MAGIRTNVVSRTVRGLMARLLGQTHNGARDLYEQCGYPASIDPTQYEAAYQRQDIAGRILEAFPDATWREPPTIKSEREGDDPDGEFRQSVETVVEQFALWNTLSRLDLLMGMGHYGVLLFGVAGGEPTSEPLRGNDHKLIYLSPHGEQSADIVNWESRSSSPRFAKPNRYRLTVGVSWKGAGGAEQSLDVHHSRVIHVAERPLGDGALGSPRLERIWNRLIDLDKLLGGSAEVYWQNAAAINTWTADPEIEWDPEEQSAMEAQFEELKHGLRRDLRLRGVSHQSLATEPYDPAPHIDKQLDMIAGAIGIPKRILIGSERGELSSEQDENNWTARIVERRDNFAGPRIVRPVIQQLINLGVIVNPGGKWSIEWPESDTLGEKARAEIANSKATAVRNYASTPGVELIVPPQEFRRWLGEEEISEFALPDLEDEEDLDEQSPAVISAFRKLKANATPRPLYVCRKLLNARELVKWAKAAGFDTTTPAEDMHITLAYSTTPIDWLTVGEAWTNDEDGRLTVQPGGARMIEALGNGEAIVLLFASSELSWRHEDIKRAGASWKWPGEFQPHVTITYSGLPEGLDLKSIEPYRGALEFGPEIFEEIKKDWDDGIVENRRVNG